MTTSRILEIYLFMIELNYELYSNTIFWDKRINGRFFRNRRSLRNRRNIWSTWRNNEHPLLTFTFTMSRYIRHIFTCNVIMSLFSLKRIEIFNSSWFSCCENKFYFWIKETKKPFILWFHIVIHFKVNSYKLFLIMFYHSREKVLKCWKIFSMHSDKKWALFCLKRNINNIFSLRDLDIRKGDREIMKEGGNDLFAHRSSIKISHDYSKKV